MTETDQQVETVDRCPNCGSNSIRVTEDQAEIVACFDCDTVFQANNHEYADRLAQLREYDWSPAIPILALLTLYHLFMPATGSPSIFSLELHQQVIALSATPTIFGSIYWFWKANDLGDTQTPEERILDE